MFHKLMALKFPYLLGIYIALFIGYVATPSSLDIVRRIISILMLIMIVVIMINSLKIFKTKR